MYQTNVDFHTYLVTEKEQELIDVAEFEKYLEEAKGQVIVKYAMRKEERKNEERKKERKKERKRERGHVLRVFTADY